MFNHGNQQITYVSMVIMVIMVLIFNHGYQFLINKVELKFLQFSGPPRKDTSFAKDILIQSVTIPGKQPPI